MVKKIWSSAAQSESEATSLPLRPKTSAAPSLSLSLHPVKERSGQDGIIVKVTPPKQPADASLPHTPCDIVLVIDVSGSMGVDAPVPHEEGEAEENNGYSVLDLVKHAAHTICATLDEGDRLGIVTFSRDSHKLLPLTIMTDENKDLVRERINCMQPDGMTNMWHGIIDGLEMFEDAAHTRRVPALMLLTDGVPNHLNPPQGFIPKIKNLETFQNATIHTFGFGYSLRSGLLKSIAELCGGNYSFIPDAGMIGTVFVHAVANLQSSFATRATLKLSFPPHMSVWETVGDYVGRHSVDLLSHNSERLTELIIDLGNIQYGQSREIYLECGRYDTPLRDWLAAAVEYTPHTTWTATAIAWEESGSMNTLPAAEVAYHISRSRIISYLSNLFPLNKEGEHEYPIPKVVPVPIDHIQHGVDRDSAVQAWLVVQQNKLRELIDGLPAATYRDDANQSLVGDLVGEDGQGQVSLALSCLKYFRRWGVHFLPSLAGAHARQCCNSFKDPGPLQYGVDSPLFNACRDKLDIMFDKLPAQQPSNMRALSSLGSYTPTSLSGWSVPSSMARYNQASAPCFAANMRVELANGSKIQLKDLRAGMQVRTLAGSNKVISVLITKVRNQELCIVNDLLVTPWHPISMDGGKIWEFPAATTTRMKWYTGDIISVLLNKKSGQDPDPEKHAMRIEGIWGVTLGHGITEASTAGRAGDVRAHAFFGNWRKVAAALRQLAQLGGSDNRLGQGALITDGVVRELDAGLVSGFKPPRFGGHRTGGQDAAS